MANHDNTHGLGGASHGSAKEYVIGLILSIVFTVIPFALVMSKVASPLVSIIVILVCALAQLLVQVIYFLHMNSSSKQMWNITTGVYTLLNFVVVLVGAIWIFSHLHHNMLMGH